MTQTVIMMMSGDISYPHSALENYSAQATAQSYYFSLLGCCISFLLPVCFCRAVAFPLPEVGLDVAGAGGARLDFLLLLLPQNPLSQQVVRSCDVVIFVGLQGSAMTVTT